MPRKMNFAFIWDRLSRIVSEQNEIGDADLMMELGFSPPSWKVWKSKFIEKSNCTKYTTTNPENKIENKITYYKKMKRWYWEVI